MKNSFLLFFLNLACATTALTQLVDTNVALGKPTIGDVAFGYPTGNGNDGNTSTFNHADNVNAPPGNPYWEVDLSGPFDLKRLEIVDRIGCCDPNRLNGSEIRVYDGLGAQIGATLSVVGLSTPSPDEISGTLTFTNGVTGWPGAAQVRVDGYTQYFQFSEFRAISLQPKQPANIAPSGFATASAATWPGSGPGNMIDNNPGSVAHPDTGVAAGFSYTVDLFQSYPFARLEIVNRADCCADRLSNYRVSLHEDNGSNAPGPALWSADVRTDGSNSGLGGIDTLTAANDGAGIFAGRFIKVTYLGTNDYNPEIAELRAFSLQDPPANLATGKTVGCFDAADVATGTWPGFPASQLVDGKPATISHPQNQFSANYYYQIDLGSETYIGDVTVYGRLDGCCADRLTNARLEIRDSSLAIMFQQVLAGPVVNATTVSTGGVTGRYVRIVNASGADYGPQIGEVIVKPGPDFITNFTLNRPAGTGSLTFTSQPGATYAIYGSNFLSGWGLIETGIASGGTETTEAFSDPDMITAPKRFYQVRKIP